MQHLQIWELHRLQHLDMSWWRDDYRRRLELHTLEICCPAMQTPSVGEVCEYSKVSSFHVNPYLVMELVLVLASCPIIIKEKRKKWEKLPWWQWLNSSSTNHCGKHSQCTAFDIKQSPVGRSPEDHQVRAHAYIFLWIKLNHASCFPYLFFFLLWFECVVHNTFKGLLNQAWCLS